MNKMLFCFIFAICEHLSGRYGVILRYCFSVLASLNEKGVVVTVVAFPQKCYHAYCLSNIFSRNIVIKAFSFLHSHAL